MKSGKKLKFPEIHGDWEKYWPDHIDGPYVHQDLAFLLRDSENRFRGLLNNEDRIEKCVGALMIRKVVVVQRRKDGKGRIAFFSPQAKWKKVKVKLGEKW